MKTPTSLAFLLVVAAVSAGANETTDTVASGAGFVPTDEAVDSPVDPRLIRNTETLGNVLLYDNGPYVTHFGTGYMGADESLLQTGLGLDTYGFGNQLPDRRVADDFTIPSGETWEIWNIGLVAYEVMSTTTSTITSVNIRIWDGQPGAGGSVVWGDTSTNRLSGTYWSNTYRVNEAGSGIVNDRPIMEAWVDNSQPVVLGPGTYWIDWQADGDSVLTGPWVPPITVVGQTTTGNALQSTDGGSSYVPITDNSLGTTQGIPFVLHGWIQTGLPPNDTCSTATVFTCPPEGGMYVVPGTTENATFTGYQDCDPYYHQEPWPEIWYRVVGNGGTVTATTCSDLPGIDDTYMMVFDGSCSGLGCVGASDDHCATGQPFESTVTWQSTAGTDYYVLVASWDWPEPYGFELTVTCDAACETLATPVITGVGGVSCGGTTPETAPVLTWTDVSNESGYWYEVRDIPTFGTVVQSGFTDADVTSVVLGPYTAYSGPFLVRVRAVGDQLNFCDSPLSEECYFEIQECEPLVTPSIVAVGGTSCGGETSETSPVLVWSDVANDQGYRWEIRDPFGGLVAGGSTGPDVTSANVGTLVPSAYTARVQAIGDGATFCDSAWTTYCPFTVIEEPCEELPAPTITAIGDTSCGGWTFATSPVLAWTDLADESGYSWEVRNASGAVVRSGETGQNSNSVTVEALEPGQVYTARVLAIGDGVIFCDSEWSSICPFEVRKEVGVADFTWWPTQPKLGERVRFADLATGDPIGWFWEMGDGWTSTEQNPSHSFDSSGDFDVSMMCEYPGGSDTKVQTVRVSGVIRCGDELCEGTETAWSCPSDCALPPESTGRSGGSDRRPTVPAAVGGTGGTGGTFWLTESWVYNPGTEPVAFVFEFTPLGSTEIMTAGPFELASGEGSYWHNLVNDLFDMTGNGALWLDAPEPVNFITRSYNSSSQGTFGQSVPGMRSKLTIGKGDGEVHLIGLREDSEFRSNLFFQEVDGSWVTLEIEVFNASGERLRRTTLDVEGHSNEMRRLRDLGAAGEESVYASVEVIDGDGRAAVIGSVVDQITGDPTTVDPIHLNQLVVKHRDGGKLVEEAHNLVAVVAHTQGVQSSVWGSKFTVSSPAGTGEQQLTLVYIPEYDRTGAVGDRLERTVTIQGGQQLVWNDVLVDLFALPQSAKTQGSLHVYSPSAVLISSRTYNKMADGGTLGQNIKALAKGDLIDIDTSGRIVGMRHTPGSRTNVGIAIFSDSDTEVKLQFWSNSPSLLPLGTLTRTVEAQKHLQIPRVFEELGLSAAPLVSVDAYVTVTEGGSAYVYASSVDNLSGDPTTIEATLNE